jgi:hypothetical protein
MRVFQNVTLRRVENTCRTFGKAVSSSGQAIQEDRLILNIEALRCSEMSAFTSPHSVTS